MRGLHCSCDGCCNAEPPSPPHAPPLLPPPFPPPRDPAVDAAMAVAISLGVLGALVLAAAAWYRYGRRQMRVAQIDLGSRSRATPLKALSSSSGGHHVPVSADREHPARGMMAISAIELTAVASDDSDSSQRDVQEEAVDDAGVDESVADDDGNDDGVRGSGRSRAGAALATSLATVKRRSLGGGAADMYAPLGEGQPTSTTKKKSSGKSSSSSSGSGSSSSSSSKKPGLAHADGSSPSLLRAQTLAWQAALRGAHDDASTQAEGAKGKPILGKGKPGEETIQVEALLEAFGHTLVIGAAFGPLLSLGVKNDESNTEKARRAWRDLEAAEPSRRLTTLRELLEAERATGIHRAGGVLADPSAAIALVWLRRSLAFQNAVFAGMVEDRASLVSTLARDAYQTHLEHFHNFWLKNTFRAGLSAMPKREDFLQRLSPNMPDEEREQLVYAEMSELVEVQMRVCAACSKLMIDLDLEDLRRV